MSSLSTRRLPVQARLHAWTPAGMSALASVFVTVASLLIVRGDGFGAFGTFVALQAIGVVLGIPMLWGVHVNASRALAAGAPADAVAGTALITVAGACLVTSAAFLALLSVLQGAVPSVAPARLWPALGLGASTAVMCLAEALLRVQGRQVLASGLRLGCAGAYLAAVLAVLAGGRGTAFAYAALVTGGNAACALLMLLGMRAGRPGAMTTQWTLNWDADLGRSLLADGWTYSTSQSLVTLLFGFDAILLMQAVGPAAVAVYALYISSLRRMIGVLFTDSLAALLIASLARTRLSISKATLRYAPAVLGVAMLGSAAVVVASLAAAGALHHLVLGWVLLAAAGCTAHALLIVLFAVFTVQPGLGLPRIRAALTAAFLPGLALQGVAAAAGGVLGLIAVFAAINVVLAWWFVAVIRRSAALSNH